MRKLNDYLDTLPLRIRQAAFFTVFILSFGSAMVFMYWLAGQLA